MHVDVRVFGMFTFHVHVCGDLWEGVSPGLQLRSSVRTRNWNDHSGYPVWLFTIFRTPTLFLIQSLSCLYIRYSSTPLSCCPIQSRAHSPLPSQTYKSIYWEWPICTQHAIIEYSRWFPCEKRMKITANTDSPFKYIYKIIWNRCFAWGRLWIERVCRLEFVVACLADSRRSMWNTNWAVVVGFWKIRISQRFCCCLLARWTLFDFLSSYFIIFHGHNSSFHVIY